MATRKTKKAPAAWLVAARKGGMNLQEPIPWDFASSFLGV